MYLRLALCVLLCTPALAGPLKLPGPAAQQASAGCAMQLTQLRQTYCGQLQVQGQSPETLAVIIKNATLQRDQIAGYCQDEASKAEVAKLDDCIASVSQAQTDADAEAATRRAAAGPAVARLKADPAWLPLRDRTRQLKDSVLSVCADARRAEEQGDLDWHQRRQRWEDLKTQHDAAAGDMRALIQKYGIDLRDGEALGLW